MLEDRLARADIIDVTKLSGDRVVFGATVKLEDTDSGAKTQYAIVGETEADLKKGRISITSPIARGLIGREVGDTVRIRAPGGERSEAHTSELQSPCNLVCRLLLEKNKLRLALV